MNYRASRMASLSSSGIYRTFRSFLKADYTMNPGLDKIVIHTFALMVTMTEIKFSTRYHAFHGSVQRVT